jgi:hypothetical protein
LDLAHGTTAPLAIDSASFGTTSCGSKYSFSPSPSQAGQAPCGALNEKSRGSISGMVKPETGQENFSEKMMRLSGTPPTPAAADPLAAPFLLMPLPASFSRPGTTPSARST